MAVTIHSHLVTFDLAISVSGNPLQRFPERKYGYITLNSKTKPKIKIDS